MERLFLVYVGPALFMAGGAEFVRWLALARPYDRQAFFAVMGIGMAWMFIAAFNVPKR